MPDDLRGTTSPVFRDLYRIRFPVMAIVSMGHRVSGLLLALCVPLLVYVQKALLSGPDGYASAGALFQAIMEAIWVAAEMRAGAA
jgi:succinate dehydrogenase / fumarate reductase, cytochrome b subunit